MRPLLVLNIRMVINVEGKMRIMLMSWKEQLVAVVDETLRISILCLTQLSYSQVSILNPFISYKLIEHWHYKEVFKLIHGPTGMLRRRMTLARSRICNPHKL